MSISPQDLTQGKLTWCGYEVGTVGAFLRSIKLRGEDSSADGRMFIASKIYDRLRLDHQTSEKPAAHIISEGQDR